MKIVNKKLGTKTTWGNLKPRDIYCHLNDNLLFMVIRDLNDQNISICLPEGVIQATFHDPKDEVRKEVVFASANFA